MKKSRCLAITTIAPPNKVLKQYSEECRSHDVELIIAGDRKSSTHFSLPGSTFLSIESQKSSGFRSALEIPENHYSRKNIAYLAAVENGHDLILETDDDNLPYKTFWDIPDANVRGKLIHRQGWINIFSYFTDEVIWPRGFPLEEIHAPGSEKSEPETGTAGTETAGGNPDNKSGEQYYCPIQQGLSDDNPDVDAVFRLTRNLPLQFKPGLSFVLSKGSWCPFNSQNTLWFREAFPLLYLPSTCSFRMTDIWRSFVAQRIAWEYGWNIAFHSPTVFQERNEHNLLKDFKEEVPGYLNNSALARGLENLTLSPEPGDIFDNLVRCYEMIGGMGLVRDEELNILRHWISDLQRVI